MSFEWFPLFRLVITDDTVLVEGRWRALRSLLPSRRCDLDKLASARLRGTLVILYLPNDEWWSVSSGMRCTKIMRELESRGVRTTRDR
jgi:transposase